MKKLKITVSVLQIIAGLMFLSDPITDIQLGFGVVLLLAGIQSLIK